MHEIAAVTTAWTLLDFFSMDKSFMQENVPFLSPRALELFAAPQKSPNTCLPLLLSSQVLPSLSASLSLELSPAWQGQDEADESPFSKRLKLI